jgi:hypothetical protein
VLRAEYPPAFSSTLGAARAVLNLWAGASQCAAHDHFARIWAVKVVLWPGLVRRPLRPCWRPL